MCSTEEEVEEVAIHAKEAHKSLFRLEKLQALMRGLRDARSVGITIDRLGPDGEIYTKKFLFSGNDMDFLWPSIKVVIHKLQERILNEFQTMIKLVEKQR